MDILRANSSSFFGVTFGNSDPVHAKVGSLDGLARGLSTMALLLRFCVRLYFRSIPDPGPSRPLQDSPCVQRKRICVIDTRNPMSCAARYEPVNRVNQRADRTSCPYSCNSNREVAAIPYQSTTDSILLDSLSVRRLTAIVQLPYPLIKGVCSQILSAGGIAPLVGLHKQQDQ